MIKIKIKIKIMIKIKRLGYEIILTFQEAGYILNLNVTLMSRSSHVPDCKPVSVSGVQQGMNR